MVYLIHSKMYIAHKEGKETMMITADPFQVLDTCGMVYMRAELTAILLEMQIGGKQLFNGWKIERVASGWALTAPTITVQQLDELGKAANWRTDGHTPGYQLRVYRKGDETVIIHPNPHGDGLELLHSRSWRDDCGYERSQHVKTYRITAIEQATGIF